MEIVTIEEYRAWLLKQPPQSIVCESVLDNCSCYCAKYYGERFQEWMSPDDHFMARLIDKTPKRQRITAEQTLKYLDQIQP